MSSLDILTFFGSKNRGVIFLAWVLIKFRKYELLHMLVEQGEPFLDQLKDNHIVRGKIRQAWKDILETSCYNKLHPLVAIKKLS